MNRLSRYLQNRYAVFGKVRSNFWAVVLVVLLTANIYYVSFFFAIGPFP